uniref:Uncharacterized protein n=1 Tax=Denticeps clupeoides TaxID=299321 RepID=A0AAY4CUM2_9TELE
MSIIRTVPQKVPLIVADSDKFGPPRNWKGIGIAMVVILAVMSLVLLSVVLEMPFMEHLIQQYETLTVKSCPSFVSENEVVLKTREGHILSHDMLSNLTFSLLDNSTLVGDSSKEYLSLLLSTLKWLVCVCVCVCHRHFVELTPPEKDTAVLQYAAWGPQGSQLVYVFENDIYYQPDVSSRTMRLSSTGREETVVNGVTDWTYEEEILLTYPALWWSVDGARLAYLTINNSATPLMEIPHFLGGTYPLNILYPYPKAGSNLPSVSLFVVNLYGPAHTVEIIPPEFHGAGDCYISMVNWISSTQLAVRWLNRVQNESVLSVCEATTGACSKKYKMAMDFWQDLQQEVPLFSTDGSVFYLTLPAKQGARGEFRHIASLSTQVSGRSFNFFNCFSIVLCFCKIKERGLLIHKSKKNSYFLSTEESRQSRHLYSAELEGEFRRHCLTCHLIDHCSFFRVHFSPNLTHFSLYCLGPGVPKVTIHRTADPSSEYSCTMKAFSHTLWDLMGLFSFNFLDLHIKLSLPPGFEGNVHALLVLVDGSPGSQSVTEEFSLDWPEVLSSTSNVALAWLDCRNRVSRPQRSSTLDHRKLDSLRVKDQLAAVEWLMQLPYIDRKRISVYGKAFGGYLSLKMLAATNQLFKCGAAMAPITDFKLYSAAFSERYLGLPEKEEHAYMAASLLEDVPKLKDEQFLLLHGSADAKVHFQHSAELLSRLVKVEANYSLQLYPDEGHALKQEQSIQHLHRTLLHYLQNCLKHDPFLSYLEEEEEEDEDD